jgi:predicted TIM-barrel fold metal-dependent hydrolase
MPFDPPPKVFDVHLHGHKDPSSQIADLKKAGVYKTAISSSWETQEKYRNEKEVDVLYGLMLPCPLGKVPYSFQKCFEDGKDWPPIDWVEEQIKNKKINFIGEILSQYYGISSSDSSLYPYYRLAEKYSLPVGIHTGAAGPGHGAPHFSLELGHPTLLKRMLKDFPSLKIWIMHAGDRHYKETIQMMKEDARIYTDISVISNPDIVPPQAFAAGLKEFIEAGLEDRIMFGSDNGDINKTVKNVLDLEFLSDQQKEKILYRNAEKFFSPR